MTKDVVTASGNASVREVADLMAKHNVGTVIITDGDGKLEGLVTDRQLVTDCIAKGCNIDSSRVGEIMTGKLPGAMGLVTASPDMDILDAAKQFGQSHIRRMPVVEDGGRLVGVLSEADIADELKDAVGGLLEEISKAEK
jgi:CBS domain-containing protein